MSRGCGRPPRDWVGTSAPSARGPTVDWPDRQTSSGERHRERTGRASAPLEWRALAERCGERPVIEIVEFAADGNAVGETRHLDGKPRQPVKNVVGLGLAFDGSVDRKDDLTDFAIAVGDAGCELVDRKVIGAYAVQRRQGAAEDVVASVGGMGAFQRPQIRHILHYYNHRWVPARVRADRAG